MDFPVKYLLDVKLSNIKSLYTTCLQAIKTTSDFYNHTYASIVSSITLIIHCIPIHVKISQVNRSSNISRPIGREGIK